MGTQKNNLNKFYSRNVSLRYYLLYEMDKDKRPSLKQALNKMKEISKSLNKDKVKKKHQEQSL